MLRNWERNGLLTVPRDPANGYRLYGSAEFGRLRVIRMLVRCGFSLMAILQMLQQIDSGNTNNLREALNVSYDTKFVAVIADRWLASLLELEQRTQKIIAQIGRVGPH
jgi:DNA-binding transcriptional MerR regulator